MIGKNIRYYRKTTKLTQEELGKMLGVGKSNISMYETDDRTPPLDIIVKMSKIFNVDISTLTGNASHSDVTKIPVLGYVAAGIPIEAVTDIRDYKEITPDMVKDGSEYFGLQIKGDSMEPRIYDGDVVIVRKQADVDSGQIAIVCINGDNATCKKVVKQSDGILLQPLNPSYAPTYYSFKETENIPVTIIGKVVELRRTL